MSTLASLTRLCRQPYRGLLWPLLGLSAVPGACLPLWPCKWVEGRWWMCWDQMERWSHLLQLPSYFWRSSRIFGLGLLAVHLAEEEGLDSWARGPWCWGKFVPSFLTALFTHSFSKPLIYLFIISQISASIVLAFSIKRFSFLLWMATESGLASIESKIFTTHICLLMLF